MVPHGQHDFRLPEASHVRELGYFDSGPSAQGCALLAESRLGPRASLLPGLPLRTDRQSEGSSQSHAASRCPYPGSQPPASAMARAPGYAARRTRPHTGRRAGEAHGAPGGGGSRGCGSGRRAG